MRETVISECGQYRYQLVRKPRIEMPEKTTALFIMLNPSTADASLDDPTIRRCRAFADFWGCAGITVANLYALRATNPEELLKHTDPIGPENDEYLVRLVREYGDVVCAWGNNAMKDRADYFIRMALKHNSRLWCLGVNKNGAPKHPLYIKADTKLTRFRD